MLNEFLFTKIEEEDIGNIWFQKDGATCHTAEGIAIWHRWTIIAVKGKCYAEKL